MKITILTLPGQRFSRGFKREAHKAPFASDYSATVKSVPECHVETVAVAGVHALDRVVQEAMAESDDPNRIVMLSNRREMVWDGGLVDGVLRSIDTFTNLGCDWSVLSCDGGVRGQAFEFAVFSP